MGRFSNIAKKATVLSDLMVDRNKIATEDIIKRWPQGFTIDQFDLVTTPDSNGIDRTYPVFTIKEDPTVFAYGGKAMFEVVKLWLDECDGDIASCSAEVSAENVKIKLSQARTSRGNNFTRVDVLS